MPRKTQTAPSNRLQTEPSSACQTAPDEAVGNFLRHLEQDPIRVRVRRFFPDGKVRVSTVVSVPAGNFDALLRLCRAFA